MLGGPQDRGGAGDLALRVDQVRRVQQVATAVTLVSSCILRWHERWCESLKTPDILLKEADKKAQMMGDTAALSRFSS